MSIGATVWGRELENSTLAGASGNNFHGLKIGETGLKTVVKRKEFRGVAALHLSEISEEAVADENVAASIGVQVPVWHQLSQALPHAVVVLQQLWTAMPVENALIF